MACNDSSVNFVAEKEDPIGKQACEGIECPLKVTVTPAHYEPLPVKGHHAWIFTTKEIRQYSIKCQKFKGVWYCLREGSGTVVGYVADWNTRLCKDEERGMSVGFLERKRTSLRKTGKRKAKRTKPSPKRKSR